MILFAIGFCAGFGTCLLAVLLFVWHVAGRSEVDEARWAEEMAEAVERAGGP